MNKLLFVTLLLSGVVQGQNATQMNTQMNMPMPHTHSAGHGAGHSAGGAMPAGHSMPQAAASVSGAYVAAQPPTAADTAAFFVLKNTGKKPLVLTGGSSLGAGSAMLMRFVKLSNGQTAMKMVDSFSVAPGQSLTLTPGGNHLMLMGLKKPLKVGESLDLKLHFADGSMLNLMAPIKKF